MGGGQLAITASTRRATCKHFSVGVCAVMYFKQDRRLIRLLLLSVFFLEERANARSSH